MITVQQYWLSMRILASVLITGQGLYFSLTNPGFTDLFNAAVTATVLYAIWFARERTV